jgi:thymidylate synthase
MKEVFVEGATLPETYHKALAALKEKGSIIPCTDWNQQQLECAMTLYVTRPAEEPRISSLFIGGFHELQQYCMEMLDGLLNFRIGKGWDYTYNQRFSEFYDYVIRELKRNSETRRAVISIRDNKADTKEGADPACLQSIQFFIREGKLDMMVLFRSNDLPEATYMNAFALIMLQEKIAGELGAGIGTYTHRSNSMHCYEKDFKLLDNYIKSINTKSREEISYNYKGDWEELMKEEIPGILKFAEDLRDKR